MPGKPETQNARVPTTELPSSVILAWSPTRWYLLLTWTKALIIAPLALAGPGLTDSRLCKPLRRGTPWAAATHHHHPDDWRPWRMLVSSL